MTAATCSGTDGAASAEGAARSAPPPRGTTDVLHQRLRATMVQAALRALGFVVLPALLTGLTLRYLLPAPGSSEGWRKIVGSIGNQYPVLFSLGLFLLFAGLVRYWHGALPGGAYLARLPAHMAARLPRGHVRVYVTAAEILRALEGRLGRETRMMLSYEQQLVLDEQRFELATALEGSDAARVIRAERQLRTLAAPRLAARQRRETALFLAGLAMAGAAALALRLRVAETYQVLSGSMLPGLTAGDRIVANKLAYRRAIGAPREELAPAPRRGDLIVFQNTVTDGPEHVVKRVIALPGDTVTMRADHPVINGWLVPSCDAGLYVYPMADGSIRGRLRIEFLGDHAYATLQGAGAPLPQPYVVKANELFVLGDNRTSSSDSRTWNGGNGAGVPFHAVEGRGEWFLLATRRDGSMDFAGFLGPLDRRLSADGIDARSLEQGIERCLHAWPGDTRPPEPDAPGEATNLATPKEGASRGASLEGAAP